MFSAWVWSHETAGNIRVRAPSNGHLRSRTVRSTLSDFLPEKVGAEGNERIKLGVPHVTGTIAS